MLYLKKNETFCSIFMLITAVYIDEGDSVGNITMMRSVAIDKKDENVHYRVAGMYSRTCLKQPVKGNGHIGFLRQGTT